MQDPCSILNNPAFIAQQNNQIQQDLASLPVGSFEYQTLQALTSVPINIGNDAVYCESNPGVTFTDSMGVKVTCPSPSHTDVTTGGQPMSTYTEAQLAQILNSQYGATAVVMPGNAAYHPPPATVQPTQGQLNTVAPGPVGSTGSGASGGSSSSGGASGGATGSAAPGGSTGSPAPGGSTGSGSTSSSGVDLSFLTNSTLITGLPNWAVAFGAIAALMILPGLIGGRR